MHINIDAGADTGSAPEWTDTTSRLLADAIAEFLEYDVSHFIQVTSVQEAKEDTQNTSASSSSMRAPAGRKIGTGTNGESSHGTNGGGSYSTNWGGSYGHEAMERARKASARLWHRILPTNPPPLFLRDAPPPLPYLSVPLSYTRATAHTHACTYIWVCEGHWRHSEAHA